MRPGDSGDDSELLHEGIDDHVVVQDFQVNGREKLGGFHAERGDVVFGERVVGRRASLFAVRTVFCIRPRVHEVKLIKLPIDAGVDFLKDSSRHFPQLYGFGWSGMRYSSQSATMDWPKSVGLRHLSMYVGW